LPGQGDRRGIALDQSSSEGISRKKKGGEKIEIKKGDREETYKRGGDLPGQDPP